MRRCYNYGAYVALSEDGHTLVVGAPSEASAATGVDGDETDNSAAHAGAAHVYTRDPMTLDWIPDPAYIKASNTNATDRFCASVALSRDGRTLAIGAYGEASAATGVGGDETDTSIDVAGAAYVYTRDPMNRGLGCRLRLLKIVEPRSTGAPPAQQPCSAPAR